MSSTVTGTARKGVRWLVQPAVEKVPDGHARATAALRVVLGLMWLYNVSWKRPPDFGQDAGRGLFKFTSYAVSHPVLAPYSWVVEHVVLKHFAMFGWLVLASETGLAVLLLTGTWLRLAAALGVAQSVAIALSVAYAPGEWPWSYWLMIGAHLAILFSSAGRVLSVEAVHAGLCRNATLLRVWGGLSIAMGLITILGSLGHPIAARGYEVGLPDAAAGLGTYNAAGGVVLLVTGGLLLVVPRVAGDMGRRLAMTAAALSALAAVSLYAQVGFSDPLLGGTATSAAYLLCLTVVASSVAWRTPAASGHQREDARAR